jgi:acyl-CoA thioesterase I
MRTAKTILILPFILSIFLMMSSCAQSGSGKIVFVPIGDSYTIGTSVNEKDRWPDQLVALLMKDGIEVELAANPAHVGWTTRDAIQNELKVMNEVKPRLTSLLIGVNDWVQGNSEDEFRAGLALLMDSMQAIIGSEGMMLVITIPDFSVTPAGARFGDPAEISKGIARFNEIIKEEAALRKLPVADIYPVSQSIKEDPETVAADGLHPSAKAYAAWLTVIAPEVQKLLSSASLEEKTIQSVNGRRIAIYHLQNNVLEGSFEWFNGQGESIANGIYKNGLPWSGTFLNWSVVFGEFDKENVWEIKLYCRDWVTLFEGGYDSAIPDYGRVMEGFEVGVRKDQ